MEVATHSISLYDGARLPRKFRHFSALRLTQSQSRINDSNTFASVVNETFTVYSFESIDSFKRDNYLIILKM
jgi:hypothetical protein